MSRRKIIGVTVGTTISPKRVIEMIAEDPPENVTIGVPPGGKAGQYLRKKSDADGDVVWSDLEIPEQYGLVTYDQDKTITIT